MSRRDVPEDPGISADPMAWPPPGRGGDGRPRDADGRPSAPTRLRDWWWQISLLLSAVGVAIRVGGLAGVLIGAAVLVGWGSLFALVWTARRQ